MLDSVLWVEARKMGEAQLLLSTASWLGWKIAIAI